MKLKSSRFWSAVAPVVLFFVLSSAPLHADTKQLCTDTDFSIELPSEWQKVTIGEGGVLCAFRSPGSFPTINVLRLSGPYAENHLALSTQGERLVESYRQAGIGDPRLHCIELNEVDGKKIIIASFSYSSQERTVASRLTILSSLNWHYLITEVHMDRTTPYDCMSDNTILSSIKLRTSAQSLARTDADKPWSLVIIVVAIVTGLAVLGCFYRAIVKRRKNKANFSAKLHKP